MTTADGRPTSGESEERSLGELFTAASSDIQGLLHDEIELAKSEMRGSVKRLGIGAGSFGAAGVLAVASVPMFSFAAAYGIHESGLPLWLSFLIVAAAFVLVAGVLALFGFFTAKKARPPKRALTSGKVTLSTLKRGKPHPAPEPEPQDAVARSIQDANTRPSLEKQD